MVKSKSKKISFRWDIQCNVRYISEMEVPEELLKDKALLIQHIEDNLQFETFSDTLEEIQDWDYESTTIHERSIQEVM